jgi:soluble lytic murein transglycosylase-like protein
MTDREILQMIREKYGTFINQAAEIFDHPPEVIAGIILRESLGDPDAIGDNGHGHGLMQIDDRSFPEYCRQENCMNPKANILFGADVLDRKRRYLRRKSLAVLNDLERASIAAYNCGEGNVLKTVRNGLDLDHYTAHQNYSKCVLDYAEIYRRLGDV